MSKTRNRPVKLPTAVEFSVERVNSVWAKRYLEASAPNRRLSRATVRRYAADMASGGWHFNLETIKFDPEGKLIDGQHRLQAIVDSGTEQPLAVLRNVPHDAIYNLDTGRRRTNADFLSIQGIEGGTQKSPISKFYHHIRLIENGESSLASFGKRQMDQNHLFEFVTSRASDLDEAISYVFSGKAVHLLQSPSVFGAMYLRFLEINPEATRDFFETLISGEGYIDPFYKGSKGHPLAALRIFLETEEERKRRSMQGGTRSRTMKAALVAVAIKSWNAWIQGQPLAEVSFNRTEGWDEIRTTGARLGNAKAKPKAKRKTRK